MTNKLKKPQWKKLDIKHLPDKGPIFCEICQVKNRGDDDWWYNTEDNCLAKLIVEKNKVIYERQSNAPHPGYIYICDECSKETCNDIL